MKSKLLYLVILNVVCAFMATAQIKSGNQLRLKSGFIVPEPNISSAQITMLNRKLTPLNKKSFAIIQFEKIPSDAERKQLEVDGVVLMDYIPENAYTATITKSLSELSLRKAGARSVVALTASQKMQTSLVNGTIPMRAKKVAGYVDVWASFPKSFTTQEVRESLENEHYEVISTVYEAYQILEIRVLQERLYELAGLPFIQYVQPVPMDSKPINNHSTVNGRANILNAPSNSGYGLLGKDIVVGVGDNANPMQHIDFTNRIINRNSAEAGAHGIHVMGTLGGAGLFSEKYAGYAPKVTMISQQSSNILAYAPQYVQDHGMVITNNSYGYDLSDCSNFGEYDLISNILDQQAFQMPYLQHVFATGNSGDYPCSPFVSGFANVLGGYQSAKNVICVGNTDREGAIDRSSSKGPVTDGRLKPEITAQGTDVTSTFPVNGYREGSGTSFAAPAVSGGLALLYEKYKLLNSANPKNGLMKAILLNGSSDKGNAGPDYQYGYGWMNLLRSVKMLESESYKTGIVASGARNSYTINIPENTAQVKVMLYWNDPAASILASKTLVNDLDLTVENPSQTVFLPSILNASPQQVNNPATSGADHTNNLEQVVVKNPATGIYKINIDGTAITHGPQQEYFVVYDIIPISTTLTYPIGKERFNPGDDIFIQWDSYGNASDQFTAEYSTNNGTSWNPVSGTPATTKPLIGWKIPDVVTDQGRVKITSAGVEKMSEVFTILSPPKIKLSDIQCEGYIAIEWPPVSGATEYEVMLLKGDEMISAGKTQATNFVITGLSKDETYWFSVRSILNASPGPRADALSRKPDSGTCTGAISDNDLKLEAIISPVSSGREGTSTALAATQAITIRIKNMDDQPSSENVIVSYKLNNGPEKSYMAPLTIQANSTIDYTFPETENFSAIGSYTLSATVSKQSDTVKLNNSISKIFKQLSNAAVLLPYLDNVESAAEQSVTTNQIGLTNADRYDFLNSSTAGRLRTFVNSGIARSGNRAFTLDTDRYFSAGNTNYLDGTFNLQNYTLSDDIRLLFRYKNHGQQNHPDNQVWIRGKYTDNWLPVFNLFANQNAPDQPYKLSSSIELSHVLSDNGQTLSRETQIRWGQHGRYITADPTSGAGYSIDDIEVRIDTDDIQMLAITSITESNCGLSNQQPVTISIRNSSNQALTNVPVKYRLGNGSVVSDLIPTINARQTIEFTFSQKLNLIAYGAYQITVWSDLSTDTFTENNSLTLNFYNNALVSSFPYLENFETGNGNWHPAGVNNTWSYGAPASTKINRAASGTKAWKTNLAGNYNNQETSYLYSPCFNISGLTNPTLSLSLALDLEYCQAEDCDLAFVDYSLDGSTWIRLGANGQGTNWYQKITNNGQAWSISDFTRWHVATIALPVTNGNIRLRFGLKADPATTKEGIAIDDIHIYNNGAGIYDEGTMATAVSEQNLNGVGWIDFKQNGKIIASLNPNGQALGSTQVQAYVNSGTVRNNGSQYYLDRTITVKPTNASLNSDATIRLYFLDTESERLINASGCTSCVPIKSAYGLGVSKYTDADKSKEDGNMENNASGIWSFITAANTIKVPYDKGYYAEIKVRNFSEFWFNNGENDGDPLPVELVNFYLEKNNSSENSDEVTASWLTTSEINAARFELERARGVDELMLNKFEKVGTVAANGNSAIKNQYSFTDKETGKSGDYYYRLKMIDLDGSFTYSVVRSMKFDNHVDWKTFPNPSTGNFQVQYQAEAGEAVHIEVSNLRGNLIHQNTIIANGKREQYPLKLSASDFPSGLYLVEVTSREHKKVFRIVKL